LRLKSKSKGKGNENGDDDYIVGPALAGKLLICF